ncbi:hypothetical protein, partial [Klebsiella pneumoniae]|uniref:hypothetical protein n=1 Tax=Klebsiella pneumoniae TaxID=573 RepID=UPI003013C8CD
LRIRGSISRAPDAWPIMVDMFFYRDPEEIEREQEAQAAAKALPAAEEPAAEAGVSEWEVSGSNAAIAAAASSQVPTSAE